MSQHCFYLTNAVCIFPREICKRDLYVRDGKICAPCSDAVAIDCHGAFVAPGLIDMQINGIGDIDFATNPEGLISAKKELFTRGTTYFLATIISQPLSAYASILSRIPADIQVHLEGPFLNESFAGAHDKEYIQRQCSDFPYQVKMVTLAPELPGAMKWIETLSKSSTVVSCGHSGASVSCLQQAESSGLQMVTHLFNAMKPFHHRDPSIIGYTLGNKSLFYSLVIDGKHLAKETVLMAYNAHPEGLILVSDCSADRMLAGRSLNGSCIAGSDILAGSHASLWECMGRLYSYTGDLCHAVRASATRPAKLLQLNKGCLLPGFDADLIVFTETARKSLELNKTFVAGSCVFAR